MRRGIFFLLLLFLFAFSSFAQDQVFFTGFFPEAAITKKLSNGNKVNFKVENQEIIYRNFENPEDRWQFKHYRTDLMAFYDWKLSPLSSMALGLFYRIQDGSNSYRLIQQFAVLDRFRRFRMGHRFRLDQTFTPGETAEFRFRYRIALDVPLQGDEVDPGESYLVISTEPIFSLQDSELGLENRFVLTLGKLINSQQKIEYSVDYRTDGFFQEGFRTRLWAKIGYFYNF
ncbi:DUF2490 domain-containing protein [Algoriphagus kandeliae]|uniref:DUF2490 domain-containing protein n=1 Tax=Algoriphagus kandeliae TaxID=2562278 RepID=A0A4Y9QY00_9BACT|nr:DUF2490 domain-containing protein [Algoriphagus kandeliae]TFV97354.1 DUF2490 domain-containing protein [Algoriphagus kandeliae]